MSSPGRLAHILLPAVLASAFLIQREARAQTVETFTGVWREEGANKADSTTPVKAVLPNQPEFANNFHGTYASRPYLLISLQHDQQPEGPYYIYSDIGNLRAELQPSAENEGEFDVIDRPSHKKLGVLRVNGDECDGRPACFTFANPSPDLPVPATDAHGGPVRYVPVGKYIPGNDPQLPQEYKDMFSPLAANFSYVFKCWDLAKMSFSNYQNPGCQNTVFADLPLHSYGYKKIAFGNSENAAVPFAWTYASAMFESGEERGHTWENGQDIMEADKLKVGLHMSLDILGFTASTDISVGSQKKVEDMYSSHYTYSKAEYLSTQFAFVLNKFYASLDRDLVKEILRIRSLPDSRRAREYQTLVDQFGTHYANAITFGAKGERQIRMTQSEVVALREAQTDVSVGITAGFAGNSAGGTVDISHQNMNKINSNTSEEHRTYFCYSGGGCDDGKPTPGGALPVQLDLRPLSDLLAPPFFTDDEILTTIRDGLSREIAQRAFVKKDNLQQPAAVFATVSGFNRHNISKLGDTWRREPGRCGVSAPCNDGAATLSTQAGTSTQIPPSVATPPSWIVPATMTPDGSVAANFKWSGNCLNHGPAYTYSSRFLFGDNGSDDIQVLARVRIPDFTLLSPPPPKLVYPYFFGTGDGFYIVSASCRTGDNPSGYVTALEYPVITEVKSARALLEGR